MIYIYIYIYRHVCLIRDHWLSNIMTDYKICLNIKSDLSDLEAYNQNSVLDTFGSDAQMSE